MVDLSDIVQSFLAWAVVPPRDTWTDTTFPYHQVGVFQRVLAGVQLQLVHPGKLHDLGNYGFPGSGNQLHDGIIAQLDKQVQIAYYSCTSSTETTLEQEYFLRNISK